MAKGSILNRTLGNPLLAGFLVTAIQDYPETGARYHTVTGAARYKLTKNVFCRAEYRYERYDQADFQTAVMTPYMVSLDSRTNTSIFLGATVPGYHVHILSLSMDYRF
jgi:predicted porin